MPVTKSVGYPGPIVGTDLSYWQAGLGRDYAVDGPNDWRVTSLTNGQLQATVAAGSGEGRGVRDTATATTVTFAPQVSTGTRYDLVVARRTWSSKVTTFTVVQGGATREGVFALRNQNPGVLDDQPIAVVPITQGASNPGTPIDVRVWQANGSAVALDDLALQYMNAPGSHLMIDRVEWTRAVNDDGSLSWITHATFEIPTLGTGLMIGNGEAQSLPAPPGVRFQMQFGTHVAKTDQAGYTMITWPVAFTGGLAIWNVWNGDDWAMNDTTVAPSGHPTWGIGNRIRGVYACRGPLAGGRQLLPNFTHRASWFAIGWNV